MNKQDKASQELIEGIITKKMDYKENSKLISIITNEGLLSLEAKGANSLKSKNNSYTKVLTKIAFHTSRHILTTGKIVYNYSNIKTDINRYEEVVEILELSNTLSEHITDYKVYYSFLSEILELIDNEEKYTFYKQIFKVKALYLLGIGPVLSKCIDCDRRDLLVGFSLEDGGMKCINCATNVNNLYTGKCIELFRNLYLTKLEQINIEEITTKYDSDDIKQLENFLDKYYEFYLGYISKSRKILKEIK